MDTITRSTQGGGKIGGREFVTEGLLATEAENPIVKEIIPQSQIEQWRNQSLLAHKSFACEAIVIDEEGNTKDLHLALHNPLLPISLRLNILNGRFSYKPIFTSEGEETRVNPVLLGIHGAVELGTIALLESLSYENPRQLLDQKLTELKFGRAENITAADLEDTTALKAKDRGFVLMDYISSRNVSTLKKEVERQLAQIPSEQVIINSCVSLLEDGEFWPNKDQAVEVQTQILKLLSQYQPEELATVFNSKTYREAYPTTLIPTKFMDMRDICVIAQDKTYRGWENFVETLKYKSLEDKEYFQSWEDMSDHIIKNHLNEALQMAMLMIRDDDSESGTKYGGFVLLQKIGQLAEGKLNEAVGAEASFRVAQKLRNDPIKEMTIENLVGLVFKEKIQNNKMFVLDLWQQMKEIYEEDYQDRFATDQANLVEENKKFRIQNTILENRVSSDFRVFAEAIESYKAQVATLQEQIKTDKQALQVMNKATKQLQEDHTVFLSQKSAMQNEIDRLKQYAIEGVQAQKVRDYLSVIEETLRVYEEHVEAQYVEITRLRSGAGDEFIPGVTGKEHESQFLLSFMVLGMQPKFLCTADIYEVSDIMESTSDIRVRYASQNDVNKNPQGLTVRDIEIARDLLRIVIKNLGGPSIND